MAADTECVEVDTVVVRRDAELTDSRAVQTVPEEYEDLFSHPDHERQEHEAERYTQLRLELLESSQKRDALKKRLAKYEQLRKLIEPLNEPQKNVQPNLVVKDGELSRELDRMRVLLARVAGRMGGEGSSTNTYSRDNLRENVPLTDREKLARVMELG